jgi:hypothetical protein
MSKEVLGISVGSVVAIVGAFLTIDKAIQALAVLPIYSKGLQVAANGNVPVTQIEQLILLLLAIVVPVGLLQLAN